ncbi:class I SAM-dependent methyltransferase [Deltaproteobacteria bacterium IMCC39524]|nr:class I SAM-dependent methyltransferase [Deltaproteobacteria bacterium IMCC39524]
MIVCPSCSASLETISRECTTCGFSPEVHEGFECWAPELAFAGDGFNPECFSGLARNEEGHFWFNGRNRLIVWALKKYFSQMTSYLEVGCGTGYVLRGVAENFPAVKLFGSELFVSGLKFASARLPDATLVQMDARKMPYCNEFDVVAAFDVLEHIEDDERALQGLFSAVKPGGGVVLTVPQHAWLWSAVDECACHQRRYSSHDLHKLVKSAGFQIMRSTSFVSFLLPAMLASRVFGRKENAQEIDNSNEFNLHPLLNSIFSSILRLESCLIQLGVNLPVGGSRLLVARKPLAS